MTVKKFKLILAAVVALILGIVILQNTDPVETEVFGWAFVMPTALLLFLAACLGGVFGSALTLWLTHRKR